MKIANAIGNVKFLVDIYYASRACKVPELEFFVEDLLTSRVDDADQIVSHKVLRAT
jgi:hypothetical protein